MTDPTYFPSTEAAGTTVEISFGGEDTVPKFGIGYWSIRGLGAPLTMMLCAAKTPFTLFLYDIVEMGDAWNSDYFRAKSAYIKDYDQPLWNLPFCVNREEKRVICQTNAVFTHLGRQCGMLGDDETSTSQCEELLCEIYDLRNVMVKFAYGTDAAASTIGEARKHLAKLEAWLELQSKKMKTGDKVVHLINGKFSAPDFHLYEMLDQFEALAKKEKKDIFAIYTRLKEFKEGFAALEENQFYLNSWLHKELPFNNTMAQFGSLPGPKTYVHGKSAKIATWRNKGVVKLSP